MRKIWNWINGISTAWGLLPSSVAAVVGTTVWVAIMATLGYLEQIQVFWIMVGLPLSAAAIITFIIRTSEWRQRISAAGKLVFDGPLLRADYTKDTNGNVTALDAAQIAMLLRNTSQFPISFIIEELHTSFEGEFPPSKPRATDRGIAPPNQTKTYTDNVIDMKHTPIKYKVSGTLKTKIRYGHPKREKYTIEQNLRLEGMFQAQTGTHVLHSTSDVPNG
jgi:hypothetical protein